MTASEYSRMRACDEDRERTADLLRTAFVEGRLSQDELDERLGRVYGARTYADLATQTADLPVRLPRPAAPPVPRPVSNATNGMAIASFVCGLLQMFFGLTTIPAVVLGHVARKQIRRTGERGDGFAVAGLALGWLGIALFALFAVLVVVSATHGGPAPGIHTGPGNGGSAP
jgi:Domain of unknown function (DUF4190)/Domain of unknown function (DUF1707)